MLKRSTIHARGGMLLAVVGIMFTLPNLMFFFGNPLELGEEWRSPIGLALGGIAVLGGAALVISGMRLRRAERAARRKRG